MAQEEIKETGLEHLRLATELLPRARLADAERLAARTTWYAAARAAESSLDD
jgi:hypothetical protein